MTTDGPSRRPDDVTHAADRLPPGRWGPLWLAASLLVLGTMVPWELYWRREGFVPQVWAVDESWLLALDRVERGSTVVLGTSRIQSAFDPAVFREATGREALLLALPGNTPLPALDWFADSTDFAGELLVELLPLFAFDATQVTAPRVIGLLERYRHDRASPARWWEAQLRVAVPRHVVFRAPQLLPPRIVQGLLAGERPEPTVGAMRPDRHFVTDFRTLGRDDWDSASGYRGLSYGVARSTGRPPTEAEFDALVARIERAAGRILDRGGRVVFLYVPACGERLAIEESRYPRERYWDVFAARTRGETMVSTAVPGMSGFPCYDGSHLDARDAPRFTRALVAGLGRGRAR